ncbi:MAG: hydrogenase [Spirochaetes bacterium GWF1_31_7]|nr:MAG: hydrogenase [Spirochaetes bacterium GWE1_32_154]OHD46117.1 MAG: hydrogenase [Spirochaetes bacterium GWE2_31_10]OHD47516.1 MAG: hydrogenase [Spirochaetes bacterium GWF1_31_7]OHD83230.1 MAG: hydrogenase [Spirochaetes bacterium RIFOXYB1_FULL_32_8]
MAFILILFPVFIAIVALAIPSNRYRPWLLPVTACIHTICTFIALKYPEWGFKTSWLTLDPVSSIVLISITLLFLFSSFYAVSYLKNRNEQSNRFFTACMATFLGLISLMIWSHHLGLMWVAMEGTTLVTAPLIYFNHSKKSIEATWKYLLVGSVGIALALLGTFFLAYSAIYAGFKPTLDFNILLEKAPFLSKTWLRASCILFIVGYGTKMGLAPMHAWKPDAYGEAPGITGVILAGGVTSGAFLALMRMYQICNAAGETVFMSRLLIFIGLFSMATAGVFLIDQKDFKRMLAYSSVEHMGILVLGLGIGGPALFGTLLHIISNGMTKGILFLSAGNIQRSYLSKNTSQVQGALKQLPVSATLFLIGFLAITGSPPFAPFISEFSILNGAFLSGHFISGGLFVFFLLIIFIGMGKTVLQIVQGTVPQASEKSNYRDTFSSTAPIFCFLIVILIIGLFLPPPLAEMIRNAALFLENK